MVTPRPIPVLVLLCALAALSSRPAAGEPLPQPLSLDQALEIARNHPAAAGSSGAEPAPQDPLYLDCHGLAFANAVVDPARNRPSAALLDPLALHRLLVLARYFDVLLADLAFARFNEAMAVAYIQFDRAANRRDLGQISDLRVLELEAAYAGILQARAGAESAQRLTRSALAGALNRPESLPRDLVEPALPEIPEPVPATDDALETALTDNQAVARSMRERDDPARRLIVLGLRQRLEELSLRLAALDAAASQVGVESAYRDLRLDQSRTLYEQEVAADLGYAMSRQTKTRLRERRVAFCRALTWAEHAALTGRSDLGGFTRPRE